MSSKLLRKSKIANFMKILSDEEAIKKLLSSSGNQEDEEIAQQEKALSMMADLLQSLTNDALLIDEIFSRIIEEYGENTEIIKYLKKHVYVIKSSNKKSNYHTLERGKQELVNKNEYPFYLSKNNKQYGFKKFGDTKDVVKYQKINKTKTNINPKYKELYGLEDITSAKIKLPDNQGQNQTDNVVDIKFRDINKYDQKEGPTKTAPSLSAVLVNNPYIRIGTRNTLELATFFNVLSTVELSKCVPYFNATFSLPDRVNKQNDRASFNVGTVNQFLDGTQFNPTTDLYSSFKSPTFKKGRTGTNGNLALFTMPQTYNNMNEPKGHYENVARKLGSLNNRITPVHDPTKPFMTLTSFKIDVAPTKGLMSFKSGKLSLVLHDRTRMNDIAPFIKPDLFGSFGSEITVTYGWSHTEGYLDVNETDEAGKNPIAKFLNDSKVTEKYIIVNSSFSIDKTGQVNIDLSIAAKGPIDFRNVQVESDFEAKKVLNRINIIENRIAKIENNLTSRISDGANTYDPIFVNGQSNNKNLDISFLNESVLSYDNFASKAKKTKREYNKTVNLAGKIARKYSATLIKSELDDIIEFIHKNSKDLRLTGITIDNIRGVLYGGLNNAKDVKLNKRINAYDRVIRDYVKNVRALALNYLAFNTEFKRKKAAYDKTVDKIIAGIDESDPFYDKEIHNFLKNIEAKSASANLYEDADKTFEPFIKHIKGKKYNKARFDKIKKSFKAKIDKEREYTTFGSFLTALLGTHLASTNKYDEVQMIFYTANEYAGAFSSRNLASLLVPKKEIQEFLREEFINFNVMTMESIISSVIQRFISVKDQRCFGLSDFFRRTENRQIKFGKNKKNKEFNQNDIDNQLRKIYKSIGGAKLKEGDDNNFDDVRFNMPSVHFTFDSLTSADNDKTICRVSIFDRNDNPFSSLNTFLKDVNNSNVIRISNQINQIRRNALQNNRTYAKAVKDFNKRSMEFVENLIKKKKLIETPQGSGIYSIPENNGLSVIKEEFKSVLPSLTLGTQNSGIIETSISTINEGKLNTIYLTRPDRNKNLNSLITNSNLPLRILPAQATLTTFGCPWVNFAQMIFLDYETGTSIDNQYNVTAISHDLTPGNFSTSLTLSYGDVYGKYENATSVITRAINKTKADDVKTKQDKDEEKKTERVVVQINEDNIEYSNNVAGEIIYESNEAEIDAKGFSTIIRLAKDPNPENARSAKYILKRNRYANLNKKYFYEATILVGKDVDSIKIEDTNILRDDKILKGISDENFTKRTIFAEAAISNLDSNLQNAADNINLLFSFNLYKNYTISLELKDLKMAEDENNLEFLDTTDLKKDFELVENKGNIKIFDIDVDVETKVVKKENIEITFKDFGKVYKKYNEILGYVDGLVIEGESNNIPIEIEFFMRDFFNLITVEDEIQTISTGKLDIEHKLEEDSYKIIVPKAFILEHLY